MQKKIFEVIFESGKDVFKEYIPCKTKKEAEKWIQGNGDIVRIKEYKLNDSISLDKILDALKASKFGEIEIDIISRALSDCDFIS